LTPNSPSISEPCREIPYATEQGIFARVTGNFFAVTGKNREFAQSGACQHFGRDLAMAEVGAAHPNRR
jgi:hypothetical protein